MSESMIAIHLRLDKYLYDILKEKSAQKGIPISRYTRSLIERGVASEVSYLVEEKETKDNFLEKDLLLKVIAELCAENTILARNIYKNTLSEDADMQSKMMEAQGLSKTLLSKLIRFNQQ